MQSTYWPITLFAQILPGQPSLNGKKPRHLSFMAAVQLMRNSLNLSITLTGAALRKLIPPLLLAMTQTEIGQRKRASQPRVIKLRPKGYPLMTKPRSEYSTC